MEEDKINNIINRIKELTTFEYYVKFKDGFELDDDINDEFFDALQIIRKEFFVRIEIYIISDFDCNNERFYISFGNNLKDGGKHGG